MLLTFSWEQRRLGKCYEECYGGGTPNTNSIEYWSGSIPWIQSSDLVEDEILVHIKKHISEEGLNNSAAKLILSKAIAVVTRVGLGKVAIMEAPYTTSQDFLSFVFEEEDVYFFAYLLQRLMKKIKKHAQGTAIKGITKEELLNTKIFIPNKEERKQIGVFLFEIDAHITVQQRKSVSKDEVMNLFLCKSNALVDVDVYANSWEQRRLGEVITFNRGLTYKPKDVADCGIRVLRSSNIQDDKFIKRPDDIYVRREAVNIEFVQKNEILITAANGSSQLVGKHAIVDTLNEECVAGGFMILANTKHPFFINALLSAPWYEKFIRVASAGGNGAIGNLSKKMLDDSRTYLPKSDEEKVGIGEFFCDLDHHITFQQRRYVQLEY